MILAEPYVVKLVASDPLGVWIVPLLHLETPLGEVAEKPLLAAALEHFGKPAATAMRTSKRAFERPYSQSSLSM